MRPLSLATAGLLVALVPALAPAVSQADARPAPGSPEYVARDTQNIADAYGRITGPGGQLQNPAYLTSLTLAGTADQTQQLLEQAASPTRPALTPGRVFPGWNVGNPLRSGWNGTRGLSERIAFTNRYGALLHGTVYRPKPGARDPYTGAVLKAPFPGVVITEGSVQGSEGMYRWLAQDLAERGYVALTYDVQGQGGGETLPHEPLPQQHSLARRATRCRSATPSRRRRPVRPTAAPGRPPSSCRTSWSAPRTRSRSSPRHPRSTTPTRAPRARR